MIELKYEWECEGDIDVNVFLVLSFNYIASDSRIIWVELCGAICECVTFGYHKSDVICDGVGRNPNLPHAVLDWFAARFLNLYTGNSLLRDVLHEKATSKALEDHFERKSCKLQKDT